MGEREPGQRQLPPELDTEARSNAIRLSGWEWVGAGLFAVLLIVAGPRLWKMFEKFDLEPDYRIPKDLSNDYWLYDRYAELAAAHYDTLVVGDSVVWGEYVRRDQTLSHYLNEQAGRERFANAGLDGTHPAALAGLLEFYGAGIKRKKVVLHCNPLWLSSPKADLRVEDANFNHPRLVPQFVPPIPSYPLEREKISQRLGIVVEQRAPFEGWTAHLQQAYYRDPSDLPIDIPTWTLHHPYDNPLKPLTRGLPPSDFRLHAEPITWTARGISKQDYPWVDLDGSLQWQSFQRSVETLRRRGNQVFVLVGPFNEHLVSAKSVPEYQKVKKRIEAWLKQEDLPYLAPPALASELYADASHPLAAGYARLAQELLKSLPSGW